MDKYAFGNYLTDLRTQRGLSQSELGEIVGVSNKAISKWENGEALPRLERLKRLADYFGVPVEELVAGGKGDEDAPGADPPSPSTTVWDGVTPEEAQRRLDLQAAYRKRQESRARMWTKILLCCDPIVLGLFSILGFVRYGITAMGGKADSFGFAFAGIVFAIASLVSIIENRFVWRGYEKVRHFRLVGCFALVVGCFPYIRDLSALGNGLPSLLQWLTFAAFMAFGVGNIYWFAFYRPVRDFLTEQSYYRHL